MSFLTGSAPKASFSTQPTIEPSQQELLNVLTSFLADPGFTRTGAGDLGGISLSKLEQDALGVPTGATGQQTAATDQAFNALHGALGYKAPTVSPSNVSAGSVSPSPITAPVVDSTAAFRSGVVEPLTEDFLRRTLPAIAGQQGGSAGGAYGSGAAAARDNAATDLERTLAQAGSTFAYDTSKLNAANQMTAGLANQSNALTAGTTNLQAMLTAALANQGAGLTAGTANQSADINAQRSVLAALGLAPTTETLPTIPLATDIGLSTGTLSPYQTYINQLLAGGTATTQQTLGVGSGGSTGLLGGLLGGLGNFAGSAGGSSLISSLLGGGSGFGGAASALALLSDRRVKENIEEVGSVDGFPLYRFKYKGVPGKHVGMIAQDVEKRLPAAVGRIGPLKTVNYSAVLEHVLREAS